MFILSSDDTTLVNMDTVTTIYCNSIFVKASLVGGKDIILKTCNTPDEAKQELLNIQSQLEDCFTNSTIYIQDNRD